MSAYRLRGLDSATRERRVVVGVDEIVGETRMPWISAEERLEQLTRASLPAQRRVRRIVLAVGDERERIEDPGLVIGPVAICHSPHRTLVLQQTSLVIDGGVVGVVRDDGVGVCPFTRAAPAEGDGKLGGREPGLILRRRRWRP